MQPNSFLVEKRTNDHPKLSFVEYMPNKRDQQTVENGDPATIAF